MTVELIERIFLTVFPLFVIVFGAFLYGRRKPLNIEFFNQANMDIFVPALIFTSLSNRSFPLSQYQDLALGCCVVVLGSGLVALPLLRLFKVNTQTVLPPMMFNNSGNLGLPVIVLAFGEEALPAAVILFLVETALHLSVGIYLLERRFHLLTFLRMPMVAATLLGLLWSFSGWSFPTALGIPIQMLGQIAMPMMLFTLGIRIGQIGITHLRDGLFGAILCPLSGIAAALLAKPWLGLSGEQFAILLVFSALPPAVLNYMLAERYDQEPHRVASIVLMGTMGALFVLPVVLGVVL